MSKVVSLAALVVMTVPALADDIVTRQEVHFDHASFVCGQKNDDGKVVRFIHSTPGTKYIPEDELAANDPLAVVGLGGNRSLVTEHWQEEDHGEDSSRGRASYHPT